MTPPRECLYLTLGLPQTATTSEIRKAYRLQALSHHPDKNPSQPAAAAERFKAVQHAYSVLSDDHERAWYDAHRSQILRGHDPSASGADAQPEAADATSVDLFACFSSAAYRGFADGPGGFYAVYADVFDRLWQEEVDEMARQGQRVPASAAFGGMHADWEAVRAFYARWDAFSSVKSFAFADKWHLGEAPNREVRRLMEKDNKKARAAVRKEFISTVRELAAFAKKRDPRVVRRRKEEQHLQEKRQELVKERQQAKARLRKDNAEQMRAARDEALEEDADGLDQILEALALDERIEADNKRAKKEKRRGKKAVVSYSEDEASTSEAEGEADMDSLDQAGDSYGNGGPSDTRVGDHSSVQDDEAGSELDELEDEDDEGKEEVDLYCVACRKLFRSGPQKSDHERSKKHRSAVAKLKRELLKEEKAFAKANGGMATETVLGTSTDRPAEAEESEELMDEDDEEAEFLRAQAKKSKKKRKKQFASSFVDSEHDDDDGGELASTGTYPLDANGNLTSEHTPAKGGPSATDPKVEGDNAITSEGAQETKAGKLTKKQQRRLRERKKREQADVGKPVTPATLKCNVCSGQFGSRNKLMRHVEQSGHALHVPGTPTPRGRTRK